MRSTVRIGVELLVLPLLAGARDEDHARTAGIDAVVDGRIVLEDEAIPAKQACRITRGRRALGLGKHLGVACRLHGFERRAVDLVDRRKPFLGRDRVVVPLGRAALGHLPVDGMQGAVAVRRHFGPLGKRQRTVVLEQDGALLQDAGCRLVSSLLGLLGAPVLLLVVVGGILLDAVRVLHRLRTLAKKGAERRRKHRTRSREQQGNNQHQRHRHHRERQELARSHPQARAFLLMCHSFSFRQQTFSLLSSETIGRRAPHGVLLTPVQRILA